MLSRIAKWGNSLAIRIPKAFIEDAGLEDGVEVDIAMEGGRIVLTPVGREYTLDELVEKITPLRVEGRRSKVEGRRESRVWGQATLRNSKTTSG